MRQEQKGLLAVGGIGLGALAIFGISKLFGGKKFDPCAYADDTGYIDEEGYVRAINDYYNKKISKNDVNRILAAYSDHIPCVNA